MPSQAPDEGTLAAALRSLYAVPPEDFMAERKRLVAEAKAAGEPAVAKEIGALRKPSLAAWAVNLLAREAPNLVDQLAGLGDRMRAAQGRLDTETLTALRPERDQLLEELVRTTARLVSDAVRTSSPAAQQEVRATAIAALADEHAMAAVASGQLARTLSYSGFGEVDLAEAVVRTTSGAILSVVKGGGGSSRRRPGGDHDAKRRDRTAGDGRSTGAEAYDDLDEPAHEGDAGDQTHDGDAPDEEQLEAALEAAETQLAQAEADVTRARERSEETRERLAVVERQLAKAREADERAREAVTDAVRARKAAEAARRTAQEALDHARSDS